MSRIPPYIWDVALALGLFLLYLELKNINLVSNEEKQLWEDYYRRQNQAQQQQQQQQGGGSDILGAIGGAIGGFFDTIGHLGDLGAGNAGNVRAM